MKTTITNYPDLENKDLCVYQLIFKDTEANKIIIEEEVLDSNSQEDLDYLNLADDFKYLREADEYDLIEMHYEKEILMPNDYFDTIEI